MIETVPSYVSTVFILTTFLTSGFLAYSIRRPDTSTAPSRILLFLLPFWLLFTAVISTAGFYLNFESLPPRVFAFGVLPAVILIAAYFVFCRASFIERLSIKSLTLLHIIRVPVEFVLLWLFQAGLAPQVMTFEGWNFDILSGVTAPIVYLIAFRKQSINRPLLIVWNIAALLLLFNIVTIALLSFPSPLQSLSFDQPNVAVAYFPYIWLPAVVVPIVLFAHLASLWKLFKGALP